MKEIIKKWWFVLVSVILLYPSALVAMLCVWALLTFSVNRVVSYIISFLFWGMLASAPILVYIVKTEDISKRMKCLLFPVTIILFSGVSFLLWM